MNKLPIIYKEKKEHIGKYYTPKKVSQPLTQREIQVLKLKREGVKVKDIALQLGLSNQRVYAILNNIIGQNKVLTDVE